ncbi:MAG: superoxide dismutase family protein [Bacteroidetes bacterium]|nr:superoxide dismutase family protein [Bacteroidota bacterium]
MKNLVLILFSIFLLSTVSNAQTKTSTSDTSKSKGTIKRTVTAIAVISGNTYDGITGVIRFTRLKKGVRISGELYGLTPGKHGFHIHEKGLCDRPDFSTAGGHFNPGGMKHGSTHSEQRHEGDFGNIIADDYGVAKFTFTDYTLSFKGTNSIIGKAAIIHEKEDDLKTDPSGNSGSRIGCGVIQLNTYRRH